MRETVQVANGDFAMHQESLPAVSDTDRRITRRDLLRTGMFAAGLAAAAPILARAQPGPSAPQAASGSARPFDYADPADNLLTLSRMWGSVEPGALAYLYVWGPAFAMTDANSFVPLFRTESLAAVRTYPLGNGAFRYLAGQVILFCDWKTGQPLDRYVNPLTGEDCEVFHYRDHPLDYTLDAYKLHERYEMAASKDELSRRLVLDWSFRDDQAYGDAIVKTRLKNKLDPAVWKRESVGEWWETFESYRWQALRSEIEDRSAPSIASFRGDFQTFKPWEPWMLMGQRPGKVLSQKTAYKIAEPGQAPRAVLDYMDKHDLMRFIDIGTDFHEQYKLNDQHFKEARKPLPEAAG